MHLSHRLFETMASLWNQIQSALVIMRSSESTTSNRVISETFSFTFSELQYLPSEGKQFIKNAAGSQSIMKPSHFAITRALDDLLPFIILLTIAIENHCFI